MCAHASFFLSLSFPRSLCFIWSRDSVWELANHRAGTESSRGLRGHEKHSATLQTHPQPLSLPQTLQPRRRHTLRHARLDCPMCSNTNRSAHTRNEVGGVQKKKKRDTAARSSAAGAELLCRSRGGQSVIERTQSRLRNGFGWCDNANEAKRKRP